jgi:hypothetical protein
MGLQWKRLARPTSIWGNTGQEFNRVIASEAKQSSFSSSKVWIASSLRSQ